MPPRLKWREVELPALEAAFSSGQTYFVPPELRPEWMQQVKVVSAAWLYFEGGPAAPSTASLSPQSAQVRVDVERIDSADPGLLKYDRYYFVKMCDGRVFQWGPVKDVEYGHHLRTRPSWITQYISPPGRL